MTALHKEFPALKVVGEVWDGNPALVSFFEGGRTQYDGVDDKVDAVFDFPLFYPMRRAFAEGHHVREVAQMLSADRLYRDPHRSLVTFLGNHDVLRFMNERRATITGFKLGYTFLLTTRGTPLIYYGDEIGLPGGGDPDNRRDFPGGWAEDSRNAFEASGRTPEQQDLYSHLVKLLQLRASRPWLRGPDTRMLVAAEQTLVYQRGDNLVAVNNDTAAATVRVPVRLTGGDLLALCAAPRVESGQTVIAIPARTGCVFPAEAPRR
jgi:glycosidase